MNRIAASATVGILAVGALAAAYVAAPYAGIHIAPVQAVVFAGILTFGASISAFMLAALSKPAEKKKLSSSTRFNDLPATEYIHPLRQANALQLSIGPDTVVDQLDISRHPSSYTDKPITVTIKKSSDKKLFNPIVLRQLFTTLKPFAKFDHIVLANEHDEFIGYIPAAVARTTFIAPNGESSMIKYIINILAEPTTSSLLREIGGLSSEETISDNDTVAKAVELSWDGLKRGLVICKGGRNRKPIGIIFKEDLYRLAAYGA